MIEKYIKSKEIPGFEAEEIKVQLKGKFVAK
jgi:HSP20 family molecular chaperone IbpA